MKIATWNVNSLTARLPRVEEWLLAQRPDVLLIQETKQTDEKFPFEALAALGYESAHFGQGQWNGVAILSSIGLSDVVKGFGDDDPEARFIGATCGEIHVYSCYVPNGRALDHDHYQYKLRWLASLASHLGSRDPGHVVVGGDFNVAPSDLDVYDPSAFAGMTHVSEPERTAIREIEATGLVDLTERCSLTHRASRGGTTATARFTVGGVCASICCLSTTRSPSSRRPVTSIATPARA